MLQQSYFLVFTMLMLFHAKNAVTDLWFSGKNLFHLGKHTMRRDGIYTNVTLFFFFLIKYVHSEANLFFTQIFSGA